MSTRLLLLLLLFGFAGPGVLNGADTGTLVGQLADTNNQITYVGEAVVFLCDAQTGLPIHRVTKQPLQIASHGPAVDNFWYVVTDENGVFEFNDVPVGRYRLVAQSWSGTRGMPKFMGETSTFVMLHGVAENVDVKQDERTTVYPRQLGNGVLRITNDPKEGGAFLLISLKPTLGDAILGPYGWGNEFISQLVGVTHMVQPHVTIFGLPEDRDVHAALLNYDNRPGFGTATFRAGQREGKLRIVASWSNGHHDPPPELKGLTDHLEASKLTVDDFLNEAEKVENAAAGRQKLREYLRKDPQREVQVPGLGKQRLADVVAALAYVDLRREFGK